MDVIEIRRLISDIYTKKALAKQAVPYCIDGLASFLPHPGFRHGAECVIANATKSAGAGIMPDVGRMFFSRFKALISLFFSEYSTASSVSEGVSAAISTTIFIFRREQRSHYGFSPHRAELSGLLVHVCDERRHTPVMSALRYVIGWHQTLLPTSKHINIYRNKGALANRHKTTGFLSKCPPFPIRTGG